MFSCDMHSAFHKIWRMSECVFLYWHFFSFFPTKRASHALKTAREKLGLDSVACWHAGLSDICYNLDGSIMDVAHALEVMGQISEESFDKSISPIHWNLSWAQSL